MLLISLFPGNTITPQLSQLSSQLSNNSMVYASYYVSMGFLHTTPVICELLGGNPTFKQWYQPDGSPVPTVNDSYGDFGQIPFASGVYLHSGYMGDDVTYYYSRQQGVYRCVITDENGVTYQLFVGLYLRSYTQASGEYMQFVPK